MFAPRDPRLERVGEILDVIDHEAAAGERATIHGEEVDEYKW